MLIHTSTIFGHIESNKIISEPGHGQVTMAIFGIANCNKFNSKLPS